ncbi:uncharacterized protein LY89DRAFT_739630 [Mollisia scopiformis]|uniref:Uncharacterized protein n=1 Tax=Mollisia scopiformis TaxID=149040 RepID=A0A194WSG8_MOLSC|nr:uncharacterized protein LY89DRAFT_739630 [Mollisia scopiformis]KUJ10629.1 hypothetical protein LY89DRAFT_739630 [Mollisia scopiformis]
MTDVTQTENATRDGDRVIILACQIMAANPHLTDTQALGLAKAIMAGGLNLVQGQMGEFVDPQVRTLAMQIIQAEPRVGHQQAVRVAQAIVYGGMGVTQGVGR